MQSYPDYFDAESELVQGFAWEKYWFKTGFFASLYYSYTQMQCLADFLKKDWAFSERTGFLQRWL